MLDPDEFLSDHGIRSMSAVHHDHPFMLELGGTSHRVDYEPAESRSGMFGGNSNWRGPVWLPINYLLMEALRSFDRYYGPEFRVPFPADPGREVTIGEAADEIAGRLERLFLRDEHGRRAFRGRTRPASPKAAPTTCCCSTSTSTGRRDVASGRATRRAGRRSSRRSSTNAGGRARASRGGPARTAPRTACTR